MTRASSSSAISHESILRSLERETSALLDDVQASFLEMDLQGQPVVEGLTGGHILTYLAREADGMADELLAATGRPVPPFDSDRQWAVERGGDRPGAVLIDDVIESSERLSDALAGVDWASSDAAIRDLPGRRLVQLVIHHADLGRPWDSVPEEDAAVALSQLPQVMTAELVVVRLVPQPGERPVVHGGRNNDTVVEGDPRALLAWASGRSTGTRTTDLGLPHLSRRDWF